METFYTFSISKEKYIYVYKKNFKIYIKSNINCTPQILYSTSLYSHRVARQH